MNNKILGILMVLLAIPFSMGAASALTDVNTSVTVSSVKALSVSPSSVAFTVSAYGVSTPSTPVNVTVTNTGTAAINVNAAMSQTNTGLTYALDGNTIGTSDVLVASSVSSGATKNLAPSVTAINTASPGTYTNKYMFTAI